MLNRRKFLTTAALSSIPFVLPKTFAEINLKNEERKKTCICVFSKHLQWLDYDEMAKLAKKLGFTGVDLTVRPK